MKHVLAIIIALLAAGGFRAAMAQDAVDGMTLNGMSTYSELRQPYYIGALYLDSTSNDASAILGSESRRRLEIRIVANEYTPRQFAMQWTQALIVNTPQQTLNAFDDAFVRWLNVGQHGFKRGDRITVDGYPDGRAIVRVDGVEIFRVKQPGFLDMLLGAWIGKRPPTSGFKHDILNMTYDASVVALYDQLKPDARRVAEVGAWKADVIADSGPESAPHKPAAKGKAKPAHPARVAAAAAAGATAAAAKAAPKTTTVAPKPTPAVAHEPASPAVEGEHAARVAAAKSPSGAKQTVTEKPKPKAVQLAMIDQPAVAARPKNDDLYRMQQAMLLRLYKSAIIKRTLKKVSYPSRAVRLDQQGKVVLDITVARNGKVLSINKVQSTRHRLLNDAAVDAVAAVSQYPVVPAALEGDTVTVTVPVTFRLRSR